MKVVFIGGRSLHILGGIESYTLNLTRELVKKGHECIVWCESDHHEIEYIDGVKVIYQPSPKNVFLCKPWCGLKATFNTVLKEKGVSAIHYNAAGPTWLCWWIPRLCGIPSFMEGHGIEWQRSKYSPLKQKLLRNAERYAIYTNQHLLMCSEAQVKYYKEHCNKESYCIPGAADLPDFERENNSDILEKWNLTSGKYFLYMGRLVQEKNPDYLIKAFINANLNANLNPNANEGWKLVIAGNNNADPQYVESLHKLAEGHKNIVFTGAVYADDKDKLLKNAYCFCLPSTLEGLSIVMMEAASYKLPVIASDIEANREFLQDDAIYVRPENVEDLVKALKQAISEPEQLKEQSRINHQKILDTYNWSKVADRYINYLHSLGIKD